ncbi:hypothetical protein [Polymorphobacter sp.]|uniref:hypothetical protein n=1 Tax=Polymorphobacter sp. TaxID=1909290 RepID=UPI003F7015C6
MASAARERAPQPLLAPLLLVRQPLLTVDAAETTAWQPVHAALRRQARLERLVPWATARITARLRHDPPDWQALVALRRALTRRRKPPAALTATPLGRLATVLATPIAIEPMPAIEVPRLRRLAEDPDWQRAMALSAPDLADQLPRVLARATHTHRDRMTLRTLTRLAWRAAGRAAPMGLLGTTGALIDGPPAPARPRTLDLKIRMPPTPPSLATAEDAEAQAWAWALHLSHLRGLADLIRAGESPRLSRDEARQLWIESVFATPVTAPLDQLSSTIEAISVLGSAFFCPESTPNWPIMAGFGPAGRLPVDEIAARIGYRLPPEPILPTGLDALVQTNPSLTALLRHGQPLPRPRRAAFRARPIATPAGPGLALRHWGGDAMTVLTGPASLLDSFADALSYWHGRWPGVDLALGAPEAADRRQALSARQIIDTADIELAWTPEQCTLLHRGEPLPPLRHPDQRGEAAMPFMARLLMRLARPAPSLMEAVLAAFNRALAARITAWAMQTPVLALPGLQIGERLVLAEPGYMLRAGGSVAEAWQALMAAGCRLGLTELRRPGVLAEPRIIDLGHPDGVALALDAENGLAHLTPIRPGQLQDYCIELTAP